VNQKFVSEADAPALPAKIEDYRSCLEPCIIKYLKAYYRENKFACAVFGDKDGTLTVAISAKSVNLGNFWSGGWRSIWTVNVGKQGQAELKGKVNINVHYFEDGNVQLNNQFDKDSHIRVEDSDSTAKAIAGAIERVEAELHKNLEEFYVNMHQNTFKAMRRFLPLSKKKMIWSHAAHAVASEMTA